MKVKWFSSLLIVVMLVIAIVPMAAAAPMASTGGDDDPTLVQKEDNRPDPLTTRQLAPGEPGARTDGGGAPRTADTVLVTLRVPLFSPRFEQVPVAMVNEEAITMEEFTMVLSMAHEGRDETKMSGTMHYDRALQRLITSKLIVQEARSMGLDELPEVREMFDIFQKRTLRDHLRKDLVKGVVVDDAEVERQYRESTKEFTMRSVMFLNEKDAQAMVDAVAAGKRYADLAEAALASGAARGNREAEKVKAKDLNPETSLRRLAKGKILWTVTLSDDRVKFGFDQAKIPAEAQAALDDLAGRVKGMEKAVYVEIEGHTDNIGSEEHNVKLGEKRAQAVLNYLHQKGGIPLHAMNVISYGESRPVADNSTPHGRAQNRRVVVSVLE